MSIGESSGPVHPETTRRSGYQYLFYAKHHRVGKSNDAQWLRTLSQEEEFNVFDSADFSEISNDRGWLYGIRPRDAMRKIPDLGTCSQQIAEFPYARPAEPWHGYPLWPLDETGPENRRGEHGRPSKDVFLKLEKAGLITPQERKRLFKGDHT